MRQPVLTCLAMIALAGPAAAQSKQTENTLKLDGEPGQAALGDLSWLVGHWAGDGLGGTCEEVWVPPLAGSKEMMGMFRYVKDGKTQFTEHFVLAEDNGSLTLKLRHFDGAFKGWEEKDKHVAFKLIKAEKGAAYFGGLTFRKTADGLDAFVATRQKVGKLTDAPVQFKSVNPGPPPQPR